MNKVILDENYNRLYWIYVTSYVDNLLKNKHAMKYIYNPTKEIQKSVQQQNRLHPKNWQI